MKAKETCNLTDAQLSSELWRCEYCEDKPCQKACPADCSPADFIMAARMGSSADFRRSAAQILAANPLGGVCGAVCPDTLCMQACARRLFDHPIRIPAVQAAIIARAKKAGLQPFTPPRPNGRKIAVLGAGPAGLGAAALLAQKGYQVVVFEKRRRAGGMCRLIPNLRLDKNVLETDLRFLRRLGDIRYRFGQAVASPDVLRKHFDAVILASGLDIPISLSAPGQEKAVRWEDYLLRPDRYCTQNRQVAIVGGGAIAVDCAVTARERGAAGVELIYRRRQENMPLTSYERDLMLRYGVDVFPCVRVRRVRVRENKVFGLELESLQLPAGKEPLPANFLPAPGSRPFFKPYDLVIAAIGSRAGLPDSPAEGLFSAGDRVHGAATVVEAVASGKNAAVRADAWLQGQAPPNHLASNKSFALLPGRILQPVPLDADFFGRPISAPFLLSAAPHTDGYEQVARAYEAGWPGAIMKTAFDGTPIHIPGSYMFVLAERTYGNCDNVSAHPLDRVCREVERLVRTYPDRLTMASTGGPVTGHAEADCRGWQSNTRKLESAGAMGIEYSLSCPQGGDGTKGDILSQDAEATAQVIDWVLQCGQDEIPKLFKLSGAVTSIRAILQSVGKVFARHPGKRAGITLANSFPSLAFRPHPNGMGEEGVVIGLSGEGILPISYLTLAKAASEGLSISGNGGPMDYRAAARFLALGARTVQFCTIVMKYGLPVIQELQSGLSFLLQERGMRSVRELIGSALPQPVTPFEELSADKQIPACRTALCRNCGNCTRCPYQAVRLDRRRVPRFDARRCIGCSLCVRKCFSGALAMRDRTAGERSLTPED